MCLIEECFSKVLLALRINSNSDGGKVDRDKSWRQTEVIFLQTYSGTPYFSEHRVKVSCEFL